MPLILDSPSPSPTRRSSCDDPASASYRRLHHHEADIVIVGAGILGCAAAVTFGRQGRSVILLEKSLKEPDRIVGELLQPGGVSALEKLGLAECLEEIDAISVRGYDVIYYGSPVLIPYPQNAGDGGEARGEADELQNSRKRKRRPEGRSFHHGRFIRRLREVAMRTENVSVVESTATEIVTCATSGQVLGVECLTKGEPDFYFGHQTIISDGYASKFRAKHTPYTPKSKSKFYGLELNSPAPSAPASEKILPEPYHGHVILGAAAPVLLYQIGTHETRALIDVPENTASASVAAGGVKGHLRNVVLPTLPASVQPAFAQALDAGKLRSMPNSWLPPATNKTPGLLLLGDALNMRHPLTGGGMTVALNDVVLLADLLAPSTVPSLGNTRLVLRQMRTFHWRRKGLTSVINILAQALYALFAADDAQLQALQLGCFRYFQRGGNCVDGPVGLLAGIIRSPAVLVYHFFAVALLAMWLFVAEGGPLVTAPLRVVGSVGVLWKACVVIFPYIFSELRA